MKSDQPAVPSSYQCPSCGTESIGRFCRNCGEKDIRQSDYSIHYFLDKILDFLTHLDSKGYRSLWLLVSKPGSLSTEYFRGSRVRYVNPIQLFISLNVIYYFSVSLFYASTFTTPLATQLQLNNYYPGYASAQVNRKMQEEQISVEALETKYNQKTNVLSRTLIFLLIPIFALLFHGFFFRKRKYFFEHVVVATHFWCFNLVLLGVILPVVTVPLMWWTGAPNIPAVYAANDNLLSTFIQVCLAAYLFLMLRRAYGAAKWYCATVAVIIAWSFFHIVWLYRFLLFEITLRTI